MRVLIAILSCHSYQARREAQSATWLKGIQEWSGVEVDCRFFLGYKDDCSRLMVSVWPEVLLDCKDAYADLSHKVTAVAKWALEQGYDYLFKCDDDTYVRPARLLASGFAQQDYSGFIEDRDCHLRAYPFPVYPHAAGGPGYWLSRKAMEVVAAGLPPKSQEDFAVGEALAKAGIAFSHDARYVHDERTHRADDRGDVLNSDFISLHKCSPAEMRRVHQSLEVLFEA